MGRWRESESVMWEQPWNPAYWSAEEEKETMGILWYCPDSEMFFGFYNGEPTEKKFETIGGELCHFCGGVEAWISDTTLAYTFRPGYYKKLWEWNKEV